MINLLVYTPIYVLFIDKNIATASFGDIALQMFYQGVMAGVIALIAYSRNINLLGAGRGSVFVAMFTVFDSLLDALILNEWPTLSDWGAIFIISTGVLSAARGNPKNRVLSST